MLQAVTNFYAVPGSLLGNLSPYDILILLISMLFLVQSCQYELAD